MAEKIIKHVNVLSTRIYPATYVQLYLGEKRGEGVLVSHEEEVAQKSRERVILFALQIGSIVLLDENFKGVRIYFA